MSTPSDHLPSSLSSVFTMVSAIPPPRPVSVNSLAAPPVAVTVSPGKSICSTRAKIPYRDVCENGMSSPIPDQSHLRPIIAPTSPISDAGSAGRAGRAGSAQIQFVHLPVEIHEVILDHIFGKKVSANPGKFPAESWSKALRHPRRKSLSNLALTCRLWSELVQGRIYRHIKVKGTKDELADCARWFMNHQHLIRLVRHIEIWIPVWGDRAHQPLRGSDVERQHAVAASTALVPSLGFGVHYHRSIQNASLEEIFALIRKLFSAARILTLEGGHCRNSPMVQPFRYDFFSSQAYSTRRLPVLENIQTLVMRGSWNLMRDSEAWRTIAQALPAITEWHCTYGSPHMGAYFSMMHILMQPLTPIRHLNLSLDGFYNSADGLLGELYLIAGNFPLVCRILAEAALHLESFSYTGRACWYLFEAMKQGAARLGPICHLRSLDIIVKGCCRKADPGADDVEPGPDLCGITHMDFIEAFETMIIKAIGCLAGIPTLKYMRIRYVDLDSICLHLNPYFELNNNECTGLWSPEIVAALCTSRPSAKFVALEDGLAAQYDENQQVVGAMMPHMRPRSIQASMYHLIADSSNS